MQLLYVEDGYVTKGYTQTGVTVIWDKREIFVPKSYMIQVQTTPSEIWQLSIPVFKNTLGDLLDDAEGVIYPDIFKFNPTTDVGGVMLAPVVEILDPYTITFEDGQYAVNLVGANSNIADRVNVNNVSVRSSNSVGLQDLTSLQAASFDGTVTLDSVKGVPGTQFPIGTRGTPSNNMVDARTIMTNRNIDVIELLGSHTLTLGDIADDITIRGNNPVTSVLTVEPDASTRNLYVRDLLFTGYLDGGSILRDCVLTTIHYFNGYIENCSLTSHIIYINGNGILLNCMAGSTCTSYPVMDMTAGEELVVRDFHGSLEVVNKTSPHVCVISLNGELVVGPSNTNGTIVVYGDGFVTDSSTGTCNVIDRTSSSAQEVWEYKERKLTVDTGIDEDELHNALDSYTNKDNWKADLTDTNDKVDQAIEDINAARNKYSYAIN